MSAKTGDGLDELRTALGRGRRNEHTTPLAATRYYVDRVFSLHGIGTVVTGTLWSGWVAEGDELRAEPAGADVRVRSVQVHDEPVERAEAGQRVALAIPGVERHASTAAMRSSSPAPIPLSYRLDVELTELEPIADHARVSVHHGTTETLARARPRLGDRFAQLRLAEPVVAARGDHVVLRDRTTLGGGRVLDPAPAARIGRRAARAARNGRCGVDREGARPRAGSREELAARALLPPASSSGLAALSACRRVVLRAGLARASRAGGANATRAPGRGRTPLDPGLRAGELLPGAPWADEIAPAARRRAPRRQGVPARALRLPSASARQTPRRSRPVLEARPDAGAGRRRRARRASSRARPARARRRRPGRSGPAPTKRPSAP